MSKILRITPREDCSSETSTHVISNGSHIRGNFKRNHSLEKRRAQIERVSREIYPERIPVIVERAIFTDVACITKNKFLVPADLTLGQFGYAIRKMIHLGAGKAIFLFVNNTLPRTSALISDIYAANADEDGYLYIVDLQWRGCLRVPLRSSS